MITFVFLVSDIKNDAKISIQVIYPKGIMLFASTFRINILLYTVIVSATLQRERQK